MRNEIILIVLFSTAGTYLARVLPFFLHYLDRLPRFFKRFLRVMPVAALGALLFPGLLNDFSHAPAAGLIGTATAAAVAFGTRNLIIPVIASVLATFLIMQVA